MRYAFTKDIPDLYYPECLFGPNLTESDNGFFKTQFEEREFLETYNTNCLNQTECTIAMPTYDKMSTICSDTLNERLYNTELLNLTEKATFPELSSYFGSSEPLSITNAQAQDLT